MAEPAGANQIARIGHNRRQVVLTGATEIGAGEEDGRFLKAFVVEGVILGGAIFVEAGVVEGVFSPGERAVVVEDLVASGGTILEAIGRLESAGLEVADVVVLIDREQGGRESLAEKGYRLHSALRVSEILDVFDANYDGRIIIGDAENFAIRAHLHGGAEGPPRDAVPRLV